MVANGDNVTIGGVAPPTTRNSYVAIAGAVNNIDGGGVFIESRCTNGSSWSCDFGNTCWGGIIAPSWNGMTIAKIRDGTSNTMMVSEVSDYMYFSTGARGGDNDMSVVVNGLYRGHQSGRGAGDRLLPPSAGMDARGQTYVTLRYPINKKTGWVKGTNCPPSNTVPPAAQCGVSDSQWSGEGANTPLASAHSGGVNALFGDGSVRFLSDSTDLLTLGRLATRDDGQVVTVPP
jgi:prepilin-type processing-associated H-X9-DG protein